MHSNSCLLDIVLDAIEERALVDDQNREVLEEVSELCYRCCDLVELSVTGLEMGYIWMKLLGENIRVMIWGHEEILALVDGMGLKFL